MFGIFLKKFIALSKILISIKKNSIFQTHLCNIIKKLKIKKMEFNKRGLLADLKSDVTKGIEQAKAFKKLNSEQLNYKENPESWSILECLEHLNLYGDFYLQEIEKRILETSPTKSEVFKSSFLGNYFAKTMQPKADGSIQKMKTFKDKNPLHSELSITTIDKFLKQQNQLLTLLEQAERLDLTKIKTKTTLPIIKFRLGDTFRFVIYHINRHLLQAERVESKA